MKLQIGKPLTLPKYLARGRSVCSPQSLAWSAWCGNAMTNTRHGRTGCTIAVADQQLRSVIRSNISVEGTSRTATHPRLQRTRGRATSDDYSFALIVRF